MEYVVYSKEGQLWVAQIGSETELSALEKTALAGPDDIRDFDCVADAEGIHIVAIATATASHLGRRRATVGLTWNGATTERQVIGELAAADLTQPRPILSNTRGEWECYFLLRPGRSSYTLAKSSYDKLQGRWMPMQVLASKEIDRALRGRSVVNAVALDLGTIYLLAAGNSVNLFGVSSSDSEATSTSLSAVGISTPRAKQIVAASRCSTDAFYCTWIETKRQQSTIDPTTALQNPAQYGGDVALVRVRHTDKATSKIAISDPIHLNSPDVTADCVASTTLGQRCLIVWAGVPRPRTPASSRTGYISMQLH
ncbi:MAG: hypothetical protein H7062_21180 [Candidatus Saccharimonas sp.]|nr:hypothetical protein [Planctomycetaceae bacterium]